MEALADAVVGTTTLLVVNFRPGFTAPLMQRSHYRQINMPPLPPAQAAVLLQDHFGNDPSLALLSRNIIERAQGNPFFLEELINALVERGDFEGEKGAYRLKGGIDSIPLPSTVQAVDCGPDRPPGRERKEGSRDCFSCRSGDFDIDSGRGHWSGPRRAIGSSPAFEASRTALRCAALRTAASCISSPAYPGGRLSIAAARTSPRASFKSGASN